MASDQLTRWDVGKNGTGYLSWSKNRQDVVFSFEKVAERPRLTKKRPKVSG